MCDNCKSDGKVEMKDFSNDAKLLLNLIIEFD